LLIAVLSQKGVVCKSTTTVHLADLDLQQTSIVWLAAADGFSIPCRAIPSDSDSVLVQLPPLLEGGRVVQRGRHDQLIADAEGVYARLLAEGEG